MTSTPILIYLGANAHTELERELLDINPAVKFVESWVYPERPSAVDPRHETITVRFDASVPIDNKEIKFTKTSNHNLLKVIESVINDKHLSLLWTRFDSKTRWCNGNEVKRYEVSYSLIKSAIETCINLNPTMVVFSYEPHMLPMYIFKKVCEAMGIKTYTMVVSPFSWRVFLEGGHLDGKFAFQEMRDQPREQKVEAVLKLIAEKKGDYTVAKPFYEKRIGKQGIIRRLFYKLRTNGRHPHKILLGEMALRRYRALVESPSKLQGRKYICVFLQLQPEQTTLPDGGLFVHHQFAIQVLHAAASELGCALVIREHPATFQTSYNSKWRPRDFYKTIKEMGPDIYFADIESDPYSLIKNSVGVAAITGTVLLEALLHGKPALAFGKHPLKGYAGRGFVDKFTDEEDLRKQLQGAMHQNPESISADVETYLHSAYPKTFGPWDYVGNEKMSLPLLRESRYTSLRQIVKILTKESSSLMGAIS